MEMQIYWWNPICDDPDLVDNETEKLFRLNGLPCLNAGGDVGSACWMMADSVLEKTCRINGNGFFLLRRYSLQKYSILL